MNPTNNKKRGKLIFKEHLEGKGYIVEEVNNKLVVSNKKGKKMVVDKKTISPPLRKIN